MAPLLTEARARLLAERVPAGHWVGELSSSALSTATATAALTLAAHRLGASEPQLAASFQPAIEGGRAWLVREQNADGGFGDTTDSPSNLSTSALAWMALELRPAANEVEAAAATAARGWLEAHLGRSLDAPALAAGLKLVYGDDRTFAIPILCAVAIGADHRRATDPQAGGAALADPWRGIDALPFELSVLPQRLFRFLGLPVVSYALPALIAIGQAVHQHAPTRNPLTRTLRRMTREKSLALLERIQPEGGGFLEAVPLTSFVVLSLIACDHERHAVVRRGLEFLLGGARADGSWPIDTNLATWLTSLSVGALAAGGRLHQHLDVDARRGITKWLVAQQLQVAHPYTGAEAGGWAWTDLPGGVPDADDTAGALLALHALNPGERSLLREVATAGSRWLRRLQNRDGGIPTFCRGWGRLPFDRSCSDLTAHALRAWAAWADELPADECALLVRARARAQAFLVRAQAADGSWRPLWFGNQREALQQNPLYGTSRVLRAGAVEGSDAWRRAQQRALEWLLAAQADDGGFGAAAGVEPSVEETALALEALADALHAGLEARARLLPAIRRARAWLALHSEDGRRFEASPIGLYFAKLWYSERLYPLIFSVSALESSAAWE